MNKHFFVITAILLIAGCASNTKELGVTQRDLPDWIVTRPSSPDSLFGTGSYQDKSYEYAEKMAIQRAASDIQNQIEVRTSSLIEDFMSRAGVGENKQALGWSQQVRRATADGVLKMVKPMKSHIDKYDGTVYMLIGKSTVEVDEALAAEAKKRESLYNEFKAKQGLEALDKAISEKQAASELE
jgi:hypothetical protein